MRNAGLDTKPFINNAICFRVKAGIPLAKYYFMCTVWDAMELGRNLGHVGYARHRIWLGHLGLATEFRNSNRIG